MGSRSLYEGNYPSVDGVFPLPEQERVVPPTLLNQAGPHPFVSLGEVASTLPSFMGARDRAYEVSTKSGYGTIEALPRCLERLGRSFVKGDLRECVLTVLCTDFMGITRLTDTFGMSAGDTAIQILGDVLNESISSVHQTQSSALRQHVASLGIVGFRRQKGTSTLFHTGGDEYVGVVLHDEQPAMPGLVTELGSRLRLDFADRFQDLLSTAYSDAVVKQIAEFDLGLRWGSVTMPLDKLAAACVEGDIYSDSVTPKDVLVSSLIGYNYLRLDADRICRLQKGRAARSFFSEADAFSAVLGIIGDLPTAIELADGRRRDLGIEYIGLTFRHVDIRSHLFDVLLPLLIGVAAGAYFIADISQLWVLPAIVLAILVSENAGHLSKVFSRRMLQLCAFAVGLYGGLIGAGVITMIVALLRIKLPDDADIAKVRIDSNAVEFLMNIGAVFVTWRAGNLTGYSWVPWAAGSVVGGVLGGRLLKNMITVSKRVQRLLLKGVYVLAVVAALIPWINAIM